MYFKFVFIVKCVLDLKILFLNQSIGCYSLL